MRQQHRPAMPTSDSFPSEGGCDCKAVRYRMETRPLFVRQRIARCPRCKVAVWSNYSGSGPAVKFVRVGTLDQPDLLPPDIHIFTASKQPWVVLPEGTPAVAEHYDRQDYWPPDSLARRQAILPLIEAHHAAKNSDA